MVCFRCRKGKGDAPAVSREDYGRIACETWLDVRAFGQVFAFKSGKKDDKSSYPYVEVRLGEIPDSTTVHSIKESFEDRAAILCIIRNMNSVKYNHEELDMKTEEQLRQLDPLVMVKSIYKSRNGGEEMPQALVDKFNTAVKIAKENEEEE